MVMNTKIKAILVIVILFVPVLFFLRVDERHSLTTTVLGGASEDGQELDHVTDKVVLDQKQLQLHHEVVQYQVVFHENDTINISAFLALQHLGTDFTPQASLFILTNGTTSIIKKSTVSFLLYVPSALLFDATVLRRRFAFGGRIFFKLLNLTRFRVGVSLEKYEEVAVKKGDIWFLTIAVSASKPGEILTIVFRSLSSSLSMELVEIERHTNIGFYSALDNDFEGRYMGVKLPFLPFGFSRADDLHKEVTTSKGSVLYFCSMGHVKGRLKVEAPNQKVYLNTNNNMAVFSYCGNLTGRWNFSASGFGFPWKHLVFLYYVDVDPHIRM